MCESNISGIPSVAASITEQSCDVLVIGGGPAGSASATRLAQQGYKVVLIEKAHHPRFHIGESLLPLNLPLLSELGVREEVEAVSMIKYGVQFVSPFHDGKAVQLDFSEAWDKSHPYAYQVRRSEFDHILIRNAERKGVRVIEGCKVTKVQLGENEGDITTVQAQMDDGHTLSFNAKFLLDASGRDTFLANQLQIKEKNTKHNSAAIFGHFKNAKRLEGKSEGNITVFWFDHGWIWFIPLLDGTMSVGAVCWPYYLKQRRTSIEEFFKDTLALSAGASERLKDATLVSDVTATGNYSYSCSRSSGPNYLLLGDAFAFIDPVFSSGVFLAMNSGFVAAETVKTCLDTPRQSVAARKRYDKLVASGPNVFSWFIYRITTPSMREIFMHPQNKWRVLEAVLSVMAGDIYRGTPIMGRLRLFRAIYYVHSAFNLKKSWLAGKRRKQNVSERVSDEVISQH
jgi:flavin-dependent dehydrogenase